MSVFDGLFTGLVIGLIFSIPAFVSETIRHGKNLPILMDVTSIWGRPVAPERVLEFSVLLHLALSVAFGGLYPLLVAAGVFSSYALAPIALYSLSWYLIFGLLAAPLLGLGFFGRREGHLVWLELLLTYALYALAFWYAAARLFVL